MQGSHFWGSLLSHFGGSLNIGGKFWAPWTHQPRNGLLRTLSGSQKVLRRPVRGFPCTGCTETLSNNSHFLSHFEFFGVQGLVSHCSAIGDTISCDAPHSAIGLSNLKFFLRCPPSKACLWIVIGHSYGKKWGCSSDSLRHHRKQCDKGIATPVSRKGGGYFGRVTKVWGVLRLGCHFSRDDFLGIFRFFYFYRLPSKLAMNLVVPSLSLMCIFLPAFWALSAQSLVLSACEA